VSDPGISLDVRLAKDGDARRYCLLQCAKLPGWVVSVDRGGRTMPQLGCVWDPDRALELWADLAAEIATLRAEGWVDAPAPLPPPPPVPQRPSADLRAIIEPFMELLQKSRREFGRVDPTGQLRMRYEVFRCDLEQAGFKVSGLERLERARAYRRLGEIADLSGDPVRAIRFYRAALASWAQVGVKRRLHALERAGWTAA
jgi:hypothetical protein